MHYLCMGKKYIREGTVALMNNVDVPRKKLVEGNLRSSCKIKVSNAGYAA